MSDDGREDDLLQQKAFRRESAIASGAIVVLMILAWTYLIWLSSNTPTAMLSMNMPGTVRTWTLAEFFFAFAMWSVMMVGMMTPSFAPTMLAYVQLGRHPAIRNRSLGPAGWFLWGYLLVWLCFAAFASAAQTALLETGLIAATLDSSSDYFSETVLILA